MKQTIGLCEFRNAFERSGRSNQFSYHGLEFLFDYLTSLENETGEEIELDVVGLCCDFAEDTPEGIANNYRIDLEDIDTDDEDEARQAVREYLEQETILVGETNEGTFVYVQF